MAQTKLDSDSLALTSAPVAGRTYAGVLGTSGQYALTLNPDTAGYSVFHLKAGQNGLDGLQFLTGSDAYSGPSTRMYLDGLGNFMLGTTSGLARFTIGNGATAAALADAAVIGSYSTTGQFRYMFNHNGSGYLGIGSDGAGSLIMGRASGGTGAVSQEFGRFDPSGNLVVSMTSAPNSCHTIAKSGTKDAGAALLQIMHTDGSYCAGFSQVSGGTTYSITQAALYLSKAGNSGRSINAAGTVNASGADYAEYMTKAADCGTIAKGQIVGIDVDGKLTDKWAAAVSFLIKSTDPSYVGGDVWGNQDAIGMARPIEPVLEEPAYTGAPDPGPRPDFPDPADLVEVADNALEQVDPAGLEAMEAAYDQALAAYQADQLAHANAIAASLQEFNDVTMPAYQVELTKFEALLEQARQRVDRMAYCGQVPVNVTGAVPGQYVVPIADGDGIAGQLVDAAAVTFDQYRRAVGIVQNILPDGRANVRVKPV